MAGEIEHGSPYLVSMTNSNAALQSAIMQYNTRHLTSQLLSMLFTIHEAGPAASRPHPAESRAAKHAPSHLQGSRGQCVLFFGRWT